MIGSGVPLLEVEEQSEPLAVSVVCSNHDGLLAALGAWRRSGHAARVTVAGSAADLAVRAAAARVDVVVAVAPSGNAADAAGLGRRLRGGLTEFAPQLLLAAPGHVRAEHPPWPFDRLVPLDAPTAALVDALDLALALRRRRDREVTCEVPALLITGRAPPSSATCTRIHGRHVTVRAATFVPAADGRLTALFYRDDGRAVDFEAEPVGPRTEADVGDAASLHLRLLTPSPVELAILHGLAAWRLDREPVGAVVRLMGPLDGGAALEDLRPVERRVRVIDFAAVERVTAAGLARLLAWLPPAGRGPPVRLRAVPAAVAEWLAGTGERGRYEVETPAAPPRRP